jgi:hypothetical protein
MSARREKRYRRRVRSSGVAHREHAIGVKGNVRGRDIAERGGTHVERGKNGRAIHRHVEVHKQRRRANVQREIIDLITTVGGAIAIIVSPQEEQIGSRRPSRKRNGRSLPSHCSIDGFDGRPTSGYAREAPIDPMPRNFFCVVRAAFGQGVDKIQIVRSATTVIAQRRHQQRVTVCRRTRLEIGRATRSPCGGLVRPRRIPRGAHHSCRDRAGYVCVHAIVQGHHRRSVIRGCGTRGPFSRQRPCQKAIGHRNGRDGNRRLGAGPRQGNSVKNAKEVFHGTSGECNQDHSWSKCALSG